MMYIPNCLWHYCNNYQMFISLPQEGLLAGLLQKRTFSVSCHPRPATKANTNTDRAPAPAKLEPPIIALLLPKRPNRPKPRSRKKRLRNFDPGFCITYNQCRVVIVNPITTLLWSHMQMKGTAEKAKETSSDTGMHNKAITVLHINSGCVLECRDTTTSRCVTC